MASDAFTVRRAQAPDHDHLLAIWRAAVESRGEIHMLFVDPCHHGRGVGTALLDDVAKDVAHLRVDVNEDNLSARRFYAARGFHPVGRSETDGQGRPFPLLHLVRCGDSLNRCRHAPG